MANIDFGEHQVFLPGFQKILREARETKYLFCIEKIRE